MKGYKVFNPDWTCRSFQYEVGGTYEMESEPVCCDIGFHFCTDLRDCFDYYKFDPKNKVAEIEAFGEIDFGNDNSKHCTNKIEIIRELTWDEVLEMVNTGKGCSGFCNSGNRNSGDHNSGNSNSGDGNSGYRNSGDHNSGNRNSGNRNSGDWNSGDCNSGNGNSGDCNSGNGNSGDWNHTNFSSGCFNTKEATIIMFNKPSEWTYRDWVNSAARPLLGQIPEASPEWVWWADMSESEKEKHPEAKATDGYLKAYKKTGSAQMWYDGLDDADKEVIKALPNFDADIFEQITGIRV